MSEETQTLRDRVTELEAMNENLTADWERAMRELDAAYARVGELRAALLSRRGRHRRARQPMSRRSALVVTVVWMGLVAVVSVVLALT